MSNENCPECHGDLTDLCENCLRVERASRVTLTLTADQAAILFIALQSHDKYRASHRALVDDVTDKLMGVVAPAVVERVELEERARHVDLARLLRDVRAHQGGEIAGWSMDMETGMGGDVLSWHHATEDIIVYATPNWEEVPGVAIDVVDASGNSVDVGALTPYGVGENGRTAPVDTWKAYVKAVRPLLEAISAPPPDEVGSESETF
jgi:hypothetical protein